MKQQQIISDLQQQIKQKIRENTQLLNQLNDLKGVSYTKDKKILSLSQTMSEITAQANKIRQDLKNKEILIKIYHNNLYNKNVEIQKLQTKFKNQLQIALNKKITQINELKQIIRQQEQEITLLMGDHDLMLKSFIKVQQIQLHNKQQRQLLKNYTVELDKQIDQLENQNQLLINQLDLSRNELTLQNQQGQDLMSQVRVMVDHMQTLAPA